MFRFFYKGKEEAIRMENSVLLELVFNGGIRRLCLPTQPVGKRIPLTTQDGVSQGSTVSMILCFNLFRDFYS